MSANYLDGNDCVWLAIDSERQVAAFVTAGVGPIPAEVMRSGIDPVVVEERIDQLPRLGSASYVVDVPRPDDFIAMAERGLFVFDWTDISKVAKDRIEKYELVASPVQTILLDHLPADLRRIAEMVRIKADFRSDRVLAVAATHGAG